MSILIAGYCYYDPFKVLRSYNDYSFSYVAFDRAYISTVVFNRNYPKYNFDSFIFGSSRAYAFRVSSWKKYLPESAQPFSFDASRENLQGIYLKIKYLDFLKVKINNALILIDRDVAFQEHTGHLYMEHPAVSGDSRLEFQLAYLKAYMDPAFLYYFYDYTFTRKYKSSMEGFILKRKGIVDSVTNEINAIDRENELVQNPDKYYREQKGVFYERKGEQTDSNRMQKKDWLMLKEIKRILTKNNANYRIILSPLYDQVKFNTYDLGILIQLFGDKIYDFSGKNYFTESKYNFYESRHYRPSVGDSILKIMYK